MELSVLESAKLKHALVPLYYRRSLFIQVLLSKPATLVLEALVSATSNMAYSTNAIKNQYLLCDNFLPNFGSFSVPRDYHCNRMRHDKIHHIGLLYSRCMIVFRS